MEVTVHPTVGAVAEPNAAVELKLHWATTMFVKPAVNKALNNAIRK